MNGRKRAAVSAVNKRRGGAETLKPAGFVPDGLRQIKGPARKAGEAGRAERGEYL